MKQRHTLWSIIGASTASLATLLYLRGRSHPEMRQRTIQSIRDGVGSIYLRHYVADITGATLSAQALMAQIQTDINEFVPVEMAQFEKTKGHPDSLAVGDEFYIHITGPWDGPVRVMEVDDLSFSLQTLDGHMEAGEIHFEFVESDIPAALRFRIRSRAKNRDWLLYLLYWLGITRSAQGNLWVRFCRRVADTSGGQLVSDQVGVSTRKIDEQTQ